MRKFQFRLAPVLRLREQHRDEARSRLAEAFEAERITLEHEQKLQTQLQELMTNRREKAKDRTLQVDRLLDDTRFELSLRAQQSQLDLHKATLREEIEKRRRALVEADRQVRALERLEEKQREAHEYELALQEAKELDEIAARRHSQEGMLS